MPRRCRVLLLQPSDRRARLRWLLTKCGYATTPCDGGDLPLRLFATGACVLLIDPSSPGDRREDAVRLARIAGVPVIALGGPLHGRSSGVDQRLPAACDDVALVAALEVACFGHEHEEHDAAATPGARALARTGSDR